MQKLAVEVLSGQKVADQNLRQQMADYEEAQGFIDAMAALGAARPKPVEVLNDFRLEAARRELVAGHTYILGLAQQLTSVAPTTELPERTLRGTRFAPYQRSEIGPVAEPVKRMFLGEDYSTERYARAAAVIATGVRVDSLQLAKELPHETRRSTLALVNKFLQNELVIREAEPERTGVISLAGITHTRRFDAFVDALPEWQRAIQLRTLAHRLGKSEDETMSMLLEVGGLLLGSPSR